MTGFLEFYEEVFGWCITSGFFKSLFAGIFLLGICAALVFIFVKITLSIDRASKKYNSTPKSEWSWSYNDIDKQTHNSYYKPRSIYSNYRFYYPYQIYEIDITGKRNANLMDYIDDFINDGNMYKVETGHEEIEAWKKDCENIILASDIPDELRSRYNLSLDDNRAFKFRFIRYITKTKQKNYRKSTYKEKQEVDTISMSYTELEDRNKQLAKIGYECSLRAYHSKNQRGLLTNDLRQKIKIRDNYTCQICGKYMPDEVGLQIDHIVPVSKGGKTVESNLQVLCSKCNARKGDKL